MKILLFLTLFLLSGCTVFMAKPEVTMKNVKMVGLDSKDMELDFYFSVKNPNSFDLRLEDYSYDVRIISLPLAKGNAKTSYDFYANSTTDLLIPVKIPYNNLLQIFKRNPSPDAIPYQIHAELTVSRGIGSMTISGNQLGHLLHPGRIVSFLYQEKDRRLP
jgi:LEA14-like dessication related protein